MRLRTTATLALLVLVGAQTLAQIPAQAVGPDPLGAEAPSSPPPAPTPRCPSWIARLCDGGDAGPADPADAGGRQTDRTGTWLAGGAATEAARCLEPALSGDQHATVDAIVEGSAHVHGLVSDGRVRLDADGVTRLEVVRRQTPTPPDTRGAVCSAKTLVDHHSPVVVAFTFGNDRTEGRAAGQTVCVERSPKAVQLCVIVAPPGGPSRHAPVDDRRPPSSDLPARPATPDRADPERSPRDDDPASVELHADLGRMLAPGGPDPIPAVALAGGIAAALAAIWLYRRLTRDDILDHDLRARMLEIVEAEPGIHLRELARRLDVHRRTIRHHVDVLAEADEILTLERGGRSMLMVPDVDGGTIAREVLCALRRDGQAPILHALAAEPGLSLSELARRIDRHPSTVKRHADDLAERGLLVERRDGSARRLRLVDEARSAIVGQSR